MSFTLTGVWRRRKQTLPLPSSRAAPTSTFFITNLLLLVALVHSCSHGGGSASATGLFVLAEIMPQRQHPQTRRSSTTRRRRELGEWKAGPSSTEINCSLSSSDYEYYIERCYDAFTQWWINGRCANGVKEETSELHLCARSDGSRPHCHDCLDPSSVGSSGAQRAVVKHVCGSDLPDEAEACGVAFSSLALGECAEGKSTAYSHRCVAASSPGTGSGSSSQSSWYLRESFYCEEGGGGGVSVDGPREFACGREWYYDFEEDEHESGEAHPFANAENRYCLDCGSAIQVCASDEHATCESLGLSHANRSDALGGTAERNNPNMEQQIGDLEGHDVTNESMDLEPQTGVLEDHDVLNEDFDLSNSTTAEGGNNREEVKGDQPSTSMKEQQAGATISSERYPIEHRSAWATHGALGAIAFGLLVPSAILVACWKPKYQYSICGVRGRINVLIFVVTFAAVDEAVSTMRGMGVPGEGRAKEAHHIVGLLLLLLVSLQTVAGFLLCSSPGTMPPPPQDVADDQNVDRDGAAPDGSTLHPTITRQQRREQDVLNERSNCTKSSLLLVSWLFIFGLGTYQVRSGLALFAVRYGTKNYGRVYIGLAVMSVTAVLVQLWLKWKRRKVKNYGNDSDDSTDGIQINEGYSSRHIDFEETIGLNW